MFRLSNEFINYEVVYATGNEEDHLAAVHEFLTANYPPYFNSALHEEVMEWLEIIESGKDLAGLQDFVFETLHDYMNDIAPLGTQYGSHESDASCGFWEYIPAEDIESILFDFEEIAPFSPQYEKLYEPIAILNPENWQSYYIHLNTFFSEIAPQRIIDTFNDSSLSSIFNDLLLDVPPSDQVNYLAQLVHTKIIVPVMNHLAPWGYAYLPFTGKRTESVTSQEQDWGFYGKHPSIKNDNHAYDQLASFTVAQKLVFVLHNHYSSLLNPHSNNLKENLNTVCNIVLQNPYLHVTPQQVLDQTSTWEYKDYFDHFHDLSAAHIYQFMAYWHKDHFQNFINRYIGSDFTHFIAEIIRANTEHGLDIGGFNEDIFTLRQTCVDCEDQDIEDLDINPVCSCTAAQDEDAVFWQINDNYLVEHLKSIGQIVYTEGEFPIWIMINTPLLDCTPLHQVFTTYYAPVRYLTKI